MRLRASTLWRLAWMWLVMVALVVGSAPMSGEEVEVGVEEVGAAFVELFDVGVGEWDVEGGAWWVEGRVPAEGVDDGGGVAEDVGELELSDGGVVEEVLEGLVVEHEDLLGLGAEDVGV